MNQFKGELVTYMYIRATAAGGLIQKCETWTMLASFSAYGIVDEHKPGDPNLRAADSRD